MVLYWTVISSKAHTLIESHKAFGLGAANGSRKTRYGTPLADGCVYTSSGRGYGYGVGCRQNDLDYTNLPSQLEVG